MPSTGGMTDISVKFRGGPWGGDTRLIPRDWVTGGRIRVPSLPSRVGITWENGHMPVPDVHYMEEMYEISRSLHDRDGFEATWLNPNGSLIQENERLKGRIAELEHFEGALQAFKVLQETLAR